MHSWDGGTIPYVLEHLFGLSSRMKTHQNALPPECLRLSIGFVDAWMKCTPDEVQRRPRNLTMLNKFKMIEARNFVMYLGVALFTVLGDLASPNYEVFLHFLKGLRILSGTSLRPISLVSCSSLLYSTNDGPNCSDVK